MQDHLSPYQHEPLYGTDGKNLVFLYHSAA